MSVPQTQLPVVSTRIVQVLGTQLFYREAGEPQAPAILLLHGFAASSFMYRNLIPLLADRDHVIAPDLPGFGFTEVPASAHYRYSFDNLAGTIDAFTDVIGLRRYAIQVFDYGAPVGWRLAVAHPERITDIPQAEVQFYDAATSPWRRAARKSPQKYAASWHATCSSLRARRRSTRSVCQQTSSTAAPASTRRTGLGSIAFARRH
jgi:pimeloyl-ACP methyl ester carboxylesterase